MLTHRLVTDAVAGKADDTHKDADEHRKKRTRKVLLLLFLIRLPGTVVPGGLMLFRNFFLLWKYSRKSSEYLESRENLFA